MSTKNLIITSLLAVSQIAAPPIVLADAGAQSAAPRPAAAALLPDTPAGRQSAAYLRVMNTGDAKAIRAFVDSQFAPAYLEKVPADRQAGISLMLARDTGGLDAVTVESSDPNAISFLARTRVTEEWYRLKLQVAPEPPHRITGVQRMNARPPADAAPQRRLTDAQVARQMDAYLQKLAAADLFSGAVLVAKDGKAFFSKAYGLASKSYNVANRTDTKFNLGSMNKMFTGVAIAQLAQQGKLSFTDTISKHLPDYPNKAVADKVTIHHLLTHTSGMGSYFNEAFMKASRDRFRTVSDYFPLFVNDPLGFEPGAKWGYSNSGFLVLGAIIEKVSGQSYFDYVREHIYKPAGMTNTDAYEMDQDVPNLAIGYTRMGPNGPLSGPRRNNLYMHVIKGGPAGGGFSTVEDLLRFDTALRGHKLLDAKHTEMVLSGKAVVPMAPEAKYAYGFQEERYAGQRLAGHSGGFPGISALLDMYRDSGYTVAVLSNYDRIAQPVSMKLREMLTNNAATTAATDTGKEQASTKTLGQ